MIVARVSKGKRQLIVLGLTRINIDKMVAGNPVHVRREAHGEGIPEDIEIGIGRRN
jgi:hypothetical protein